MWSIYLKSCGGNRWRVILLVKELLRLTTTAAKAQVDSDQALLISCASAQVEDYALRLRAAGAKIRIEKIPEEEPWESVILLCGQCNSKLLVSHDGRAVQTDLIDYYTAVGVPIPYAGEKVRDLPHGIYCPRGCPQEPLRIMPSPQVPFDDE